MHVKSREYKVIVDRSFCIDLEAALSSIHDETGDLGRSLGLGFAGKFDAEDPKQYCGQFSLMKGSPHGS
jgi:hypothetical protein